MSTLKLPFSCVVLFLVLGWFLALIMGVGVEAATGFLENLSLILEQVTLA